MTTKKIIVFDLDDTLYYEIDYLISAYREIATNIEINYSLSDVFAFMLKSYHDKKNVFEEVNKIYSLDIPIDNYLSLYRNHIPNINLTQKTQEILSILHANKNNVIGLLTDGREITQKHKITALGLERYIKQEDIVISESFGSAKPSLENYMYFQQRYSTAKFIYVGDNVSKDFVTPNKLNWVTVCLLDNGRNIHRQDFTKSLEYLPKYKITNIKDLLGYV